MSRIVRLNGVYLIYFAGDGERFRPRSYHYSVHKVQVFVDERGDGDVRSIELVERVGPSGESKDWIGLNDYLKARRLIPVPADR